MSRHIGSNTAHKSKRDSLNFEGDRLLHITTDFYFGTLIALDSIKKQGLSVHMKVFEHPLTVLGGFY